MPDYSKSLIYKLCCKDASITDIYIGSTTNKTKRKYQHKENSNGQNNSKYNYPVYQFIREHGQFDNWDLIVLEEYPCENKTQLLMKEREWIERLIPTLNSHKPFTTKEEKKEQKKKSDEKHYKKNSSEIIKRQKKYYKKNIDEIKKYKKEHHLQNIDKHKEQMKQYREKQKKKNKSAIIIQQFFKKYFQK